MKKFDSNIALRKTNNRNNSRLKYLSIGLSVTILVIVIICFSFARFESIQTFSLINGTANVPLLTLTEKVIDLKSKGATDLEYDGVETLGEYGTPDNNLRYIGATPNNYVYFNCSTTDVLEMNDSTCERWRIIGLLNNVEDENGNKESRVKIIRSLSLGIYSWDTSDSSVNTGGGINQWGESTYVDGTPYEGADLMRELNTDYLGNITVGTDGKWYSETNNNKSADMPTSSLNINSQNMIQEVKWNLGAVSSDYDTELIPRNVYASERSNNIGKVCDSTSTYCNDTVIRTATWTGKVALAYPSDCGYATSGGESTSRESCLSQTMHGWSNSCYHNSWLFREQRLLTPKAAVYNKAAFFTYIISSGSFIYTDYAGSSTGGYGKYRIYPSVYLKNNIKVVSGDGSSTNPYKLIM